MRSEDEKATFHIEYSLWDGRQQYAREGYFKAYSRVDAINDLLYEYRHDDYEVTCIDHIERDTDSAQTSQTEGEQ